MGAGIIDENGDLMPPYQNTSTQITINPSMPELSLAANAVLDVYMDNCGWLDGPLRRDYQCVAAVLRSAADQLQERKPRLSIGIDWSSSELYAIAAELEAIGEEDDLVITVETEVQ
jgi:hypothetical protein